jgi:hypothetical protein
MENWIPAFAGMTGNGLWGFSTEASIADSN